MTVIGSILMSLSSCEASGIGKKLSVPEGHTCLQTCKVLKRKVWLQCYGIKRRPVCLHLW